MSDSISKSSPVNTQSQNGASKSDDLKGRIISGRPSTEDRADNPLDRTDAELATRLADARADRLRYVPALDWMRWSGRRWEIDADAGKMATRDMLKGISDDLEASIAQAKDEKTANARTREAIRLGQARTVRDVAELARIDPLLRSDPTEFDSDPMLLNCQNVTIDLRTGEPHQHHPADRLTKLAAVDYVSGAACPNWERTIARAFDNDTELIGFVQKVTGLCLTGLTVEQALFFLYGVGRNGKTTITETILAMLGDYAIKMRAESILMRNHDGIPNDIAALRGARLVVASELPQGRQLNESLVKDLTGGDTITARLLYREGFSFKPTFKLVMYGNHKPEIRGGDDGIWRRVRMIPFEVQIPEDEVDKCLPDKLRAELSGILNWALSGLKAWQCEGLNTPATVKNATAAYRAEEDELRQYIAERCVVGDDMMAEPHALYENYKAWGGQAYMSLKAFGMALEAAGFSARRSNAKRYRVGLGLVSADPEP